MAALYDIFLKLMLAVLPLLLFGLVWFYWSHRKMLSIAWKLPTMFPAFPIIGHGYVAMRGNDGAMNYFINTSKKIITSGSGSNSVLWLGPYPLFYVCDPEDIYTLLQNRKSIERGFETTFINPFLGNGLISCFADVWRITRPHVNPMFHPRNLGLLYPMMNDLGRELVSDLAPHVGAGLCDVEPFVQPIFFKSTCKLTLGLGAEVDKKSDKSLKYLKTLKRLAEILAERFMKVYAWSTSTFRLFYKNELLKMNNRMDNFIIEAIQSSRKQNTLSDTTMKHGPDLSLKNEEPEHESDTAGRREQVTMQDVYKVIQANHPSFTNKDMIDQVNTMIFAGTDTSRVTLSACILALAAHHHLQDKLYSEIVTVTGDEDCDVTPEHIRAMPYLDQVLKETLRRFITVPMFSRRVQEDLKLRDWTIPEGSLVLIAPTAIHYNPKLYPDPERFDPDRFSPEEVAARGNHSYIAFGSGPRICIGKVYASMTLKIFLIHVIKKYKFSTTVDINSQTLSCGSVAGFKEGYKVEIEVR